MKKIIFVFLLFLISCSTYKTFYIYQQEYPKDYKDAVINDIYTSCKAFKIDSIPLNDWIEYKSFVENNNYFTQKMLIKEIDKTQYVFIFITYYNTDTTYYEFRIRCKTKDKNLIRLFNK